MSDAPLRIQSAMVLFALEEALGDFVVANMQDSHELPVNIRAEIERRVDQAGFVPVSQIVQETYLREILDLAVEASSDRSEHEALLRIRELATSYDLFEIRNAVCHPNRPFPSFYWFRMAALASEPCIEQARFRKVSDAFQCAIEERLSPPPEGWLHQRAWTVPNSLPTTFDHQVTGLIARQSEAVDFRKRLRNLRNSLIAIVGPGGTGKTALCLEILRESCQDPSTLKWADQVIYVSAKTEKLTARGIEPIADPLTSLESVKTAIIQALYGDGASNSHPPFEQITQEMADRKLLLCIDNLETLLRDHPEDFDLFVQDLPRDWRVLVTSRVSVNAANVLPLGPIRREGGLKLARDYASLRCTQRFDETKLDQLVDACDRNPLAIRLAIDSFAAGSPLADALAQTKDKIVDFSYTSLVEHLPESSRRALESLFGANQPLSRSQIGNLLGLTPDEVAEAVNSLLRTSLITRVLVGSGEKYALSSSVRDLLLKSPQDAQVRDDVYRRLRDQERIADQIDRSGTRDPLDESYLPQDTPAHIKVLIAKVRPSVIGRASRGDQARDLADIQSALNFENGSGVLYRTEALLLEQLGDPYRALEALNRAVSSPEGDECAQLQLAELLRDEQRLEEAVLQTTPLIDKGYLTRAEISTRNRARLFRAHYVSMLWLKHYEEILNTITVSWQTQGELRPANVALRVSALQRSIDEKALTGTDADDGIAEILRCLTEGFRLDGYLPETVHEGFRALDRFSRMVSRAQMTGHSIMSVARFLDVHLPSMCASSYEREISDSSVREMVALFRANGGNGNPLASSRWSDLVFYGTAEDTALSDHGYIQVRISNVLANYVFATSPGSTHDYFIHRAATDLSIQEFSSLKEGQLMWALPSDELPAAGKAIKIRHAMLDADM